MKDDVIRFFVAGIPRGQPRTRAALLKSKKTGKQFVHIYTPTNQIKDWLGLVIEEAKKYAPFIPVDAPVEVNLLFIFPRPKAHYNSKGLLKDNAPLYHTNKPDEDNLKKLIYDVLVNLNFFRDDSIICSGSFLKIYTNEYYLNPGVEIEIKELREENICKMMELKNRYQNLFTFQNQ